MKRENLVTLGVLGFVLLSAIFYAIAHGVLRVARPH
jgi:hypothetical protein